MLLSTWMILPLLLPNGIEQTGAEQPAQTDAPKEAAVRVGLKLGAQVSPRFSFAGGLDIELSRLSIAPGWSSRLDADVLLEPTNDGLFSQLNSTVGLTFNQIYSRRQSNGRRLYGGAGIGYYIVPVIAGYGLLGADYSGRGHLGGKVLFGAEFTSTTGVEASVHIIDGSRPLFAIQARLKL